MKSPPVSVTTNVRIQADSKAWDWRAMPWAITGILLGACAASNRFYQPSVTTPIGFAAWGVDMALVLTLSAYPAGGRIAILVSGLFLAVPCFLVEAPLLRGILMCFAFLPMVIAIFVPSINRFRERAAFICSWGGTRELKRRERRVDVASLGRIAAATVALGASIATVKAVSNEGWWTLARWLAGGVMILAFAEIMMACHKFISALIGVTAPCPMESPHLSTSVSEFWTKRWNPFLSLLFREYWFKPVARRSPTAALWIVFAVSGVVHALVAQMALGRWKSSLEWGAFFLAQPLLIAAERWMKTRQWRPAAKRIWTLTALAMTAPLFVEPALQIIGQSWGRANMVLTPTIVTLGFLFVATSFNAASSLACCPDQTPN